jgi:DNA-binding MarR family transcriptional regulator
MAYDLDWELRLGFLLHDVARLRRSLVDRYLKPLNVTRSQWWVLAFLSRRDGMSQVALAEELDLGKVALGGLIDRLEAAAIVERRPDPIDRRVKRVFLTKAGAKLMKDIRASSAQAEDLILSGIDDADLQATVRALRGMKANLLNAMGGERSDTEDPALAET